MKLQKEYFGGLFADEKLTDFCNENKILKKDIQAIVGKYDSLTLFYWINKKKKSSTPKSNSSAGQNEVKRK